MYSRQGKNIEIILQDKLYPFITTIIAPTFKSQTTYSETDCDPTSLTYKPIHSVYVCIDRNQPLKAVQILFLSPLRFHIIVYKRCFMRKLELESTYKHVKSLILHQKPSQSRAF